MFMPLVLSVTPDGGYKGGMPVLWGDPDRDVPACWPCCCCRPCCCADGCLDGSGDAKANDSGLPSALGPAAPAAAGADAAAAAGAAAVAPGVLEEAERLLRWTCLMGGVAASMLLPSSVERRRLSQRDIKQKKVRCIGCAVKVAGSTLQSAACART